MNLNIKIKNKKLIIIIAVILILGILASLGITVLLNSSINTRIENGDFSSWDTSGNPVSWNVYKYRETIDQDNKDVKYYKDSAVINGKQVSALCLETTAENDVRFYQTLQVKPGSYYKITYWIKIDGTIETGYGAGLSLFGMDTAYPNGDHNFSTGNEWKQFTLYGVTDKKQNSLQLALGLGFDDNLSLGKIWIADVNITNIKKSDIPKGSGSKPLYSANLAENPSLDFKGGKAPNGWEVYNWLDEYNYDNKSTKYYMDKNEPVYGRPSVCIEAAAENDVRFYQDVKVSPNSYYKIKVKFKVDGTIENGCGAAVSIYDNKSSFRDSYKTTNDEWITSVSYGLTGDDQESVKLAVGLGGFSNTSTGKIWIADVVMVKINESDVPDGVTAQSLYVDQSGVHKLILSEPLSKIIFTACVIAVIIFVVVLAVRNGKKKESREGLINEGHWQPGMKLVNRSEILLMAIITAVYLLLALYNLGDTAAPQTYFTPDYKNAGESVEISFNKQENISRLMYHTVLAKSSADEDLPETMTFYDIDYLNSDGDYAPLTDIRDSGFYKWHYVDLNIKTDKLKITADQPGLQITEFGFLTTETKDGKSNFKLISPVKVNNVIPVPGTVPSTIADYEKWFDEQDTVVFSSTFMNSTYFDEVYFPRTAYEDIHGLKIYETTHPPLGKLIQAAGISVLGMNPFGWRIMGTLFGAAMIPLMFLLAKKMFNSTFFAFLAAALMMFDTMHFVQTRLATIDSYPLVFIILMYYFMYDIFISRSYELKPKQYILPLLYCGICFGLGSATKWIGIYAGVGLAILFILSKIMEINDYKKLAVDKPEVKEEKWYKNFYSNNVYFVLFLCIIFFIVIPIIIYTLSYIPNANAHGETGNLIDVMMKNQKFMFGYHSKLTAAHQSSSEWWQWIVDAKPFWYYQGDVASGMRSTIASFGNPVIWWTGILALFATCYITMKKADKRGIFILVAYACQLFPWMLIFRAVFIYHYFSCLPFLILSIVYVSKHLYDTKVIKKWMIITFLCITGAAFFIFYPAMSGMTVPQRFIDYLKILPQWYF